MKQLPLPPAPTKVDPAQEAYFYRKGWNACADKIAALEAERDALRKLLRECDDYMMCVEQQSMSRNNAESLASELRAAIAEKEPK